MKHFFQHKFTIIYPKWLIQIGLILLSFSYLVLLLNDYFFVSALIFYIGLTIAQQGFWAGASTFAVNNNTDQLNNVLNGIKNVGFVTGLIFACFFEKDTLSFFIVIVFVLVVMIAFLSFKQYSNDSIIIKYRKNRMHFFKYIVALSLVFISTIDYYLVFLIMKEYELSAIVFILCLFVSVLAIPFAEKYIYKVHFKINTILFFLIFLGGYIGLLVSKNAVILIVINFFISFSFVVLINYFLQLMTEEEWEDYFYFSQWFMWGGLVFIGFGNLLLNIKILFALVIGIGLLIVIVSETKKSNLLPK